MRRIKIKSDSYIQISSATILKILFDHNSVINPSIEFLFAVFINDNNSDKPFFNYLNKFTGFHNSSKKN